MTTRRHFLAATALFASTAALAKVQGTCAVFTKDTQSATTSDQALVRLKEGGGPERPGCRRHADEPQRRHGLAGPGAEA